VKRKTTLLALLALALPLVACGGGGHGDSSDGIVGRLTGDPDDEVASDLEKLVDKALARSTSDEPIDD
jgi:hypothetical protein